MQNEVWILTQICHAISVVLPLQNKRNERNTQPWVPVCAHSFSSELNVRSVHRKGSSYISTVAEFSSTTNVFKRLFHPRAKAAKARLKAKANTKARPEQPLERESVIIIKAEGSGRNSFTVILVSGSHFDAKTSGCRNESLIIYVHYSLAFSTPK